MNLLSHENLLTQYGYHCGFLIIFVFLYYKSPGHVGLTKEFYEHSWGDLKFYFINSLKQSKLVVTSLFLKDKQLLN